MKAFKKLAQILKQIYGDFHDNYISNLGMIILKYYDWC